MTREFEERSKAYNGNTDALMADLEGHRQALRDQREEQYKSIEAARLARERERDQVKPKEEEEETLKEGVRLPHLWETTEVPRHKNLLDVIRQQFGSKGGREQTYVNNTGSGRSEASLSADEAFRLLRKRQDISGLRVDNTTTQQVDRQQVECEESHSSGAQTCQLCCEEKIDNQNSSFCSCGYTLALTAMVRHATSAEYLPIKQDPGKLSSVDSPHQPLTWNSIETISRPEDPVARPRGRIGGASSDDLIALSTQLLASLPSRVQPPKTSNRSCDPTEGEAISQVQPPHPPTGFQRPNRSDNGGEKEEVSRNLPRNPPPPLDVAGDQRNASGGIESGTTGREEVNEAACRKSVAERLLGFTDAKRQGGGKEFNPETVGEVEGDEEMDGETRHKRELLRKHLNTDPGFILPELKGFPCRAEVLKMRRTELLDVVYTWPTILDLKSVHMISTSNLKDRILTFLGEKARQFLQPESKRVSPSRTDVQARRDGGSDKRGKEPVKEPTPPEVQAPCDLTSLPTASLFDMGGLQKGAKAKKGRALLQDLWDKD
ncbi:hypothetical protein GUITHDRAFT_134538 [Guillardia theta CCMP2712]|uniref:Uncharacterized protein n=1 Tax=Guillardia theta (strain CCMP2712) TaxID=905079 RepID=L1JU81_GUITC|nr:hypothetical protein GUITHDRAFT_134538 [Guillardia theta CCMP2712]EKX51648.1 hypothetical protein GUITHDRAFT_134538 [Guillardia theta CCMP2712]|eukprot:XP_005838628.1 hypothetical protein GUITHDRAFT_134538 [Guillardia theta CCMP2712]